MFPAPSVAICVHVQLWLHPASPASPHCPSTHIVDSLGGCFTGGYLTHLLSLAVHSPATRQSIESLQSVFESTLHTLGPALHSPIYLPTSGNCSPA